MADYGFDFVKTGLLAVLLFASVGSLSGETATQQADSPDHRYHARVKDTPGELIATGLGEHPATELWLTETATGQNRLLTRGHDDKDLFKVIAGIDHLCFSAKGDILYFDVPAFATSHAIWCYDLKNHRAEYLIDGFAPQFIRSGPYQSNLLVERCFIHEDEHGETTGRRGYLWLITSDGFPLFEIGETGSAQAEAFIKTHLKP